MADPSLASIQLDALASVAVVAAGKRRSLELLGLSAGGSCLDVGCGNGPELANLARIVGSSGRVVGLDRSSALIEAARVRGLAELDPIELVVGDACSLPFADAQFDACRADRTLQHLAAPDAALAEMSRVTRAGGRVVVTESRWGLAAPSLDREVTEHVLAVMVTESERKRWLGYGLPSRFESIGLTDVHAVNDDYTICEHDELVRFMNLKWSVDAAVRSGALRREQADSWSDSLRDLVSRGEAMAMVRILHVTGTTR
jgi:SAM-dependent methyltransferase